MKTRIFLVVVIVYISVVSAVDRFYNPELSETELFLRLPNAVILDFEEN